MGTVASGCLGAFRDVTYLFSAAAHLVKKILTLLHKQYTY